MLISIYLQVLRWSALGAGIFYGFYHQMSLSSAAKTAAAHREFEHKQKLIEQAKAEYAKKNMPAGQKSGDGSMWSSFIRYSTIFISSINTYTYI